ncbi:MAG: hypothetical protein D6712_04045 [Chloroflexi bacterium]|nr:MAG: hypothetical protein D6712_04045 [Chloroflexota bacterium]
MKRFILFAAFSALLLVFGGAALAQDDIITLNDASPSIDAVITLPQDMSGVVSLDLQNASVTMLDSNNEVVFLMTDPRVHHLELSIAPNTGTHTVHVERLPGAVEAYVRIESKSEMTTTPPAAELTQGQVTLNQEAALPLNSSAPGGSVDVAIPQDTTGLVQATFPGANATAQVVDESGQVVAAAYNGHVDAVNMLVDGGNYTFTILGNNLASDVVAGVAVAPQEAVAEEIAPIAVDNSADMGIVETGAPAGDAPQTAAACTATISASSVNLRSGPGTGYTVLSYGYRGETYPVGGQNPQGNWFVIGTDTGSAWVSGSVIVRSGECDGLTVYNIPYREAEPAPVVIVTPDAVTTVVQPAQPAGTYYDDDYYEHEDEHEHEEHEHEEHEHEEHDDD